MTPSLCRGLLAVGIVLFSTSLVPTPANAAPVPFSDPSANGYIGLCDAAGKQVMSGNLTDKPFISMAVSSSSAPAGYWPKSGGKASLYAYQPIDGIDPGDWSGQQLTGSSEYSNGTHPMAQGTVLDYSMGDFVSTYPPKWDRLVQLRMFYGAPNKAPAIDKYPATVLRIEGSRWTAVQGGVAECNSGKAISTERLLLPASRFRSAAASIAAASASATQSASRGATTPSGTTSGDRGSGDATSAEASSSGPSGTASGPPTSAASDAAQSRASDGGSSWGPTVVVVVGALVLAVAAGWWFRRRAAS